MLNKVRQSLKWKKSPNYCAHRLGITLDQYKDYKRQLIVTNKITEFKEDLDNGTAEIKAISTSEPRTPEEIIKLLKLDTTKWKLSSYWNKERHDGWHISAMVTAIKKEPKDYLLETLENFKPSFEPITSLHLNDTYTTSSVGVISTQDLHFGKEDNEDITSHFKSAITNLVHRAFVTNNLEKIIYVVGGDLLNMDTFSGTTTSGTPLDNSQRAQEAYTEAFDALHWSISYIKQFCQELHVVYLPGNHDRLSSYHMAHALSKCFSNDTNIIFDVEYKERKVITYGDNFFGFEHGDVTKKNTPLVYATEFAKEWGNTKYRICFTGHFHSKKTIEYVTENEHNGFSVKHLPSLCSTDYWHYHNKFIGSKRQAIMEIYDKEKGKTSEFIYTI